MRENLTPLQTQGPAVGPQFELTDAELILRLAQHDREAFQILYQRYERRLYSLALRVSRNRHSAEEGLQEALTRIWLRAGSFRPEGNARAWIVRILVRECLKKNLKPTGPVVHNQDQVPDQFPMTIGGASPTLERQEALAALRQLVSRRPLPDRQILALHFSEGLTQQEISRVLGIPQTTVSRKLTKILGQIRAELGALGLCGVGAIDRLIHEELSSQTTPPPALSEKILTQVPLVHPGYSSPGILPLKLAAVMVMIISGAVCLYALPGAPANPLQAQAAGAWVPTPGRVVDPAHTLPSKLSRIWTFERGISPDLSPFNGTWRWEGGRRGLAPAAMTEPFSRNAIYLALPVRVSAAPLRLRASIRMPSEYLRLDRSHNCSGLSLVWNDTVKGPKLRGTHRHRQGLTAVWDESFTQEVYVYREFIVNRKKGMDHFFTVVEYEQAPSGGILTLILHGLALERLALEEIDPRELPALLQTPEILRQHLKDEFELLTRAGVN